LCVGDLAGPPRLIEDQHLMSLSPGYLHSQNPDLFPATSLVRYKENTGCDTGLRERERERERSLLCSSLQQIEGCTGPMAPFWERSEAINQVGRPSVKRRMAACRFGSSVSLIRTSGEFSTASQAK